MISMLFVILLVSLHSLSPYVCALLPKGAQGVNTPRNLTTSALTCLDRSKFDYVNVMLSNCMNTNVNPMAMATIGNWIHAQFTKPPTARPVGLYGHFIPCFCCDDPTAGVKVLFDAIAQQIVIGLEIPVLSYLYIEVEPCGSYCGLDNVSSSDMVQKLSAVINEAEQLRVGNPPYRVPIFANLGIFTRKSVWDTWLGGSTEFSNYFLWYVDYYLGSQSKNMSADCSDWNENNFGGWSPFFKQYAQNVEMCNDNFDLSVCCDCQG